MSFPMKVFTSFVVIYSQSEEEPGTELSITYILLENDYSNFFSTSSSSQEDKIRLGHLQLGN